MLDLFRSSWARLRSPKHYRAMQTYIAEASLVDLKKRGYDLSRLDVLEPGAGVGGYSSSLQRESKTFLASDLHLDRWFNAARIPCVCVDVRGPFPFRPAVFDLIYCSSLIEHVADPRTMLRESWRVLRPGGVFFLSFPPFYSLFMVGGHQFKPFHFLGERLQVADRLSASGFVIRDVFTRMSRLNTAHWPGLLSDLATWHVCYIAQKLTDWKSA